MGEGAQNRDSHLLGTEERSSPFPDQPGPPLSDGVGSWVNFCQGTAAVLRIVNAVFSHRNLVTVFLLIALPYHVTKWDTFAPCQWGRGHRRSEFIRERI